MTKEELSQLIAIRDGAPNGATHHDSQATWKYKNLNRGTFFVDASGTSYKINEFFPNEFIRSLDDINQLIEQAGRIKELEQTLREIERSVRNENELLEMQKNQDIRDLEQQAKGVEKAADVREINWTSGDRHTLHLLAKQLRVQAKQLKERK